MRSCPRVRSYQCSTNVSRSWMVFVTFGRLRCCDLKIPAIPDRPCLSPLELPYRDVGSRRSFSSCHILYVPLVAFLYAQNVFVQIVLHHLLVDPATHKHRSRPNYPAVLPETGTAYDDVCDPGRSKAPHLLWVVKFECGLFLDLCPSARGTDFKPSVSIINSSVRKHGTTAHL